MWEGFSENPTSEQATAQAVGLRVLVARPGGLVPHPQGLE
jgi:hypothetical protein